MGFISPIPTDANGQVQQTGHLKELGKDDFLQLLVAQMQNQDPMNPMSDQDSIAQLAQFSTLEQMNNIADGIATSNEWDYLQMQSLNNVMASGLIGKDAKASYSGIYVEEGQAATINYTLKANVSEVTFEIRDASGSLVATLIQDSRNAGVNQFDWDGTDSSGNRVPDGYYSIKASATLADGTEFSPELSLVGTVESVIYRQGSAFLRINGTEIPLGDVSAVGEPGSFDPVESDDDGNGGE